MSNTNLSDKLNSFYESVTGGLKSINTDHSAVHKGLGFCFHNRLATLSNEVGSNKKVYRLKTPLDKYLHIKNMEIASQGSTIVLRIVEAPTITVAGTEIANAIQQMNRTFNKVAQSKIYDSTVAYTGGTIVCEKILHGWTDGINPSASRVSSFFSMNPNLEYVFKNNTDYIIEIENIGVASALQVMSNFFFYEEDYGQ